MNLVAGLKFRPVVKLGRVIFAVVENTVIADDGLRRIIAALLDLSGRYIRHWTKDNRTQIHDFPFGIRSESEKLLVQIIESGANRSKAVFANVIEISVDR